jgi:transposase
LLEFQGSGSWYLLPDNASAHSSGVVFEFLAKRGIHVLSHPSYFPDLAPADFLFPKLKIVMKGIRFEAVSLIQQTMTRTEGETGRSFYLFCVVMYGLSSGT